MTANTEYPDVDVLVASGDLVLPCALKRARQ